MTPTDPTPLTAEELEALREDVELFGRDNWATVEHIARLLATLDARELDVTALRMALEEAITLPLGGGWQLKQAQWRKVATEFDRAALSETSHD